MPDTGFNNGRINYLRKRLWTVKMMFGPARVCEGGISVNVANPYTDYELFAYMRGNPVDVYHIPKQVRFRIEKTDKAYQPPRQRTA
jgi:hypothetical protein